MKILKLILSLSTLSILIFSLSGCGDKNSPFGEGQMEFKMTDAPVDDAEIEGVFVTVTEIRIDGEVVSEFQGKQTIDILAYQNGNTKSLGTANLDAKSYSEITLVLDNDTDVDGNTPGCYVKTVNGTKHKLATNGKTQTEITFKAAMEVAEDAKTNAVIDFDLRKAITYDQSGGSKSFSFVSDSELKNSLRAENEAKTAKINGSLSNSSSSDLVVAYIYKKGEFNQSNETQPQGESGITFKNAVTSAVVKNETYTLAFLQEGEYEICYASYTDSDQDGEVEFEGFLTTSLSLSGSVSSLVTVEAGVDLSLSFSVEGIIK